MIDDRMLSSKTQCLEFRERMRKEEITVTDRVGGPMNFFHKKPLKHASTPPHIAPKVPQRDAAMTRPRKLSVTVDGKPITAPPARYLHTKARAPAGGNADRSLLEDRYAGLPLYSSFAKNTEFSLPPLPKLK